MAEELLSYVPVLRDLPAAVTVAIVAMLPVIELRGAIPLGVLLGLSPVEAAVPAVIGNLIPVPPLVWWLDPVQRWLSNHSTGFARFFDWLFTRTRTRGSDRFERFRDLALILFVAVPLPGTGAWTGAAGAFVFGIKGWKAFLLIAIGVILAAIAVTAFTTAGKAVVDRAVVAI